MAEPGRPPGDRPDHWSGDVVVVGAGPAGLAAARELGDAGLDVLLVDENPRAGGQIWRQRFTGDGVPEDDPLTRDLGPRVRLLTGAVCHGGAPDDLVLTTSSGVVRARARATVVACGSAERAVPVPGWTLPGVMTAGAAQTFLKGSGVLPFRRVVVAGTGPLLLATAAQLVRARVEVVALAEAARPGPADWRHAARLVAAPELLAEGARYLAALARAGVRPRTRTAVTRVEGDGAVTGAWLSRLRDDWTVEPSEPELVPCDAVLLSPGFASNVELSSQLGCRVVWDDRRQTWTPWRDADLRTSVPGVRAVGDCAGVGGVKVAALEGTLAGLVLAGDLTQRDVDPVRLRRARRRLTRFETFRAGMDAMFRPRPGSATWADDDTVVCRCEGSTAAQVRGAVAAGAGDLHGVKLRTRAGMGPCQGRVCSPAIAEQVLHDTGVRPPPPPARFPVRPLPVAAVTGARPSTGPGGAPQER